MTCRDNSYNVMTFMLQIIISYISLYFTIKTTLIIFMIVCLLTIGLHARRLVVNYRCIFISKLKIKTHLGIVYLLYRGWGGAK